jgi:hypothetical protein
MLELLGQCVVTLQEIGLLMKPYLFPRDVAFYLLRDFHDLALTPKAREYFDEAEKENIARQEKEEKKQHGREEAAGKVSGPGE